MILGGNASAPTVGHEVGIIQLRWLIQYAGVEANISTPLMKPILPGSCIILFFIQYCSLLLIDCGGKVTNQLYEYLKDVLE